MTGNLKDFCQSCGMPFDESHRDLIGKEKNGSDSPYCMYCYQNGVFTDPDATMEDMINKGVAHNKGSLTEEEARTELYRFLPKLARWAK
ncbi:MAG: zinc ribbon domain-containing protein [Peptococcaceae bacterium]|nr:zinc ribbon domain-containing protein [Peptococcaceae bacterium]